MNIGVMIVVIIGIIFMLPLGHALYSCSDECTLLRLSGQTNAHASVYNQQATTYTTEICIDDYFSECYTNPDRSSGSTALWLSGASNAHAATTSQSGYTTAIRYPGLSCAVRTSCLSGETALLSLSGNSNAHLGIPSNYGNKLCCTYTVPGVSECGNAICEDGEDASSCPDDCSSGTCGIADGLCPAGCSSSNDPDCNQASIDEVAWWSGGVIAASFANQTVHLRAETSINSGTVRFEIYENDLFSDDPILVGSSALTDSISGGVADVSWFISDSVMEAARSQTLDEDQFDDDAEFYFIATIINPVQNPAVTAQSGDLIVADTAGPNNAPYVTITAPKNRGLYFTGTSIMFNASVTDAQGLEGADYLWTIDEDSYETSEQSFSHTFTSAGIKTITLRVTDSGGLWNEDQVNILVISSPGMLAYIDTPMHRQVIPAQANNQLMVSYDGTDSYAVQSTGSGCPVVTCLAGACPAQTENVPSGCAQTSLPIANSPQSVEQITFSWIFDDGIAFTNSSGTAGASGQKLFGSAYAGDRVMNLITSYTDGSVAVSGSVERLFTLGQCVNSKRSWIDIRDDQTESGRYSTLEQNNFCRGADGARGTNDDCCPSGFVCGDDDANAGTLDRCYDSPADDAIDSCIDYTNEVACTSDSSNIAQLDPLWQVNQCGEVVNGTIIECGCSWTGTSCVFNAESFNANGDTQWACFSDYTEGECLSGYKVLSIDATFLPAIGSSLVGSEVVPQCIDQSLSVLCGRPTVELNFFDWTQFSIALALVAILYVYIAWKKELYS